jgi:hypothetical protein
MVIPEIHFYLKVSEYNLRFSNWNIYIFLGPMGMGGPGGGLSALMGARPSSAQSTASEP